MAMIGMIGLGVMGSSLAQNFARQGIEIIGFDRQVSLLQELENKHRLISTTPSLSDLVQRLPEPRIVLLMVNAGQPVDDVLAELLPQLTAQDIVIDGGNSYFEDTLRRQKLAKSYQVEYVGAGISGGQRGALWGPSIMVGCSQEVYDRISPLFTAVAANSRFGPCCRRVGLGGAGHLVKMVHNGIEYAIMQHISELYDVMRQTHSMEELPYLFSQLNEQLETYLLEITSIVLQRWDTLSDGPLVEQILDVAGQKGTGNWTQKLAHSLALPTVTLNAAVDMRNLSVFRDLRLQLVELRNEENSSSDKGCYESQNKEIKRISAAEAQEEVKQPEFVTVEHKNTEVVMADLVDAFTFVAAMAFSQGLWLIKSASEKFDLSICLVECLQVWANGCIIRTKLLDDFLAVIDEQDNYLLIKDRGFMKQMTQCSRSAKELYRQCLQSDVPAMGLASAINYWQTLTTKRLPLNLIQAQRDLFGAHTYRRIDREGVFHTDWEVHNEQ